MKRLKLVQDKLDTDFIHVYVAQTLFLVCTVHIDFIDSLFSDEIAYHFGEKEAKPLIINSYGPADWAIEETE